MDQEYWFLHVIGFIGMWLMKWIEISTVADTMVKAAVWALTALAIKHLERMWRNRKERKRQPKKPNQ